MPPTAVLLLLLVTACAERTSEQQARVVILGPQPHQTVPVAMVYKLDGSSTIVKNGEFPVADSTHSVQVTAKAGQWNTIVKFNQITPDCRVNDKLEFIVHKPPTAGEISGHASKMVAHFADSDPSRDCNGKTFDALELSYEPNGPGTDTIGTLATLSSGKTVEMDFVITTE